MLQHHITILAPAYEEINEGRCADTSGLSENECENMANENGLTFGTETAGGWPSGCYRGSKIWFNKAQNNVQCNREGVKACFCKIKGKSYKTIFQTSKTTKISIFLYLLVAGIPNCIAICCSCFRRP